MATTFLHHRTFSGHSTWWVLPVAGGLIFAPMGCGARSFLDEGTGGSGASSSTTFASSTGASSTGGSTTSTSVSTTGTGATTTTTPVPPVTLGSPSAPIVISQTPNSKFEGETSVVATDSGKVVAVWIASSKGSRDIYYAVSLDDGKSWGSPIKNPAPDGRFGTDPFVAADKQGNVYVVWGGFHLQNSYPVDNQVYIARMLPELTTFGPPILASDPADPPTTLYDKPWIAVTPKDAIVVSYLHSDMMATFDELIVARSTDHGQSFARTTMITTKEPMLGYNLSAFCTSAETGRVYATYMQTATQPTGQIDVTTMLSWSDDDGVSWPAANRTTVSTEPDVSFMDPTCAASGSDVWVQYPLSSQMQQFEVNQMSYSVPVRHSADGGATFDAVMDTFNDIGGSLSMLADLGRLPDGTFTTVYYAGQGEMDEKASFHFSHFTFGQPLPPGITIDTPIELTGLRQYPRWLGDYVGQFVGKDRIHMTFVVNPFPGVSHVAYSSIPFN